jgi:hypothetical protein
MAVWMVGMVAALAASVVIRVAYRRWRRRRIAARRIVEKPNSAYDPPPAPPNRRLRWESIQLDRLHPINREEVERLLAVADAAGPEALGPRDCIFLDSLASSTT